jgi:hypothetical protein
MSTPMNDTYRSFAEFYPYYLSEHENPTCRRLHFVGSTIGLACAATGIMHGRLGFLPLGLVVGYGCSWVGHFFFEKNRPATFRYPLYSFIGDWVMWKDIITGRIKW